MRVYYSIQETRKGADLSCKATEDMQAHREVMPYRVSAALVQTVTVSRKYHPQTVLLLFNI